MNVSAPFITRPIATTMLMVALLLVGMVAYLMLPVAPLPQVDFPTIQVTAQLPGTSPETMASTVATPLERQFSQIAGVAQLTSVSGIGTSAITVQFNLSRNIDAAAQDIQAAINAAAGQLPKNLPSPPTYKKTNPSDAPVMILALTSEILPLTTINDYADNIVAQQLSQVDGVALVLIAGAKKAAVRIEASPVALAGRGLGLEDIRAAVSIANLNAPKGTLNGPRQGYTLENNDQLMTAENYRPIIVAWRNGSPVRLSDVSTVVDGAEESRGLGTYNGKPSILLIIQRQPGVNVIATVERIRAALPHLQASIPPAIDVHIVSDRTQTIRASVSDVQFTLILTIGLVVMVIFLFLRNLKATLIPSVTVPLSLIGTFAVMYLLGYSLDNLSLMALTIAVGFVVDDAIVMLENIYRHVEEGMEPYEAALKGAGEIGFTIISISCSLIAVFIPLLLMGGIVGRLFREFAMTVTVTIVVSAIVSLTLTPMMCSRLLRHSDGTGNPVTRAFNRAVDRMVEAYRRGLERVLRHQTLTLLITLATVGATIWLYVAMPKGFLPQQDTGLITAVAEAGPEVSFVEMQRLVGKVIEAIKHDPDVIGAVAVIGVSPINPTPNAGHLAITLKNRDQRQALAGNIVERLKRLVAPLPGMVVYFQPVQEIQILLADKELSRVDGV